MSDDEIRHHANTVIAFLGDREGKLGTLDRRNLAMARRLLELLPRADDGEKVTAEWLKAVGFARGMQPAASNDLSLWDGKKRLSVYQDRQPQAWVIQAWAISDGDAAVYLPAGLMPTARGDVRRLLSSLRISFTEPPPCPTTSTPNETGTGGGSGAGVTPEPKS